MSFEMDEIRSVIKKLNDDKDEIGKSMQRLSSSSIQLESLSNEVRDIINSTQSMLNGESDRESVFIDSINKISAVVIQRPSLISQSSSYFRGKSDQIESIVENLTDSIRIINERNKNQETLIQKIKSGDISMKQSGPSDVQVRNIGERPEGILNIRKAKEKMKRDEDDLTVKNSEDVDIT